MQPSRCGTGGRRGDMATHKQLQAARSRTLAPMRHAHSYSWTAHLALGGGSARAFSSDLKAATLWVPSQNGLFADCPHRQSEIVVRPARSNLAPPPSLISKAPVMRSGPLVVTWIFVSLMGDLLDKEGALETGVFTQNSLDSPITRPQH